MILTVVVMVTHSVWYCVCRWIVMMMKMKAIEMIMTNFQNKQLIQSFTNLFLHIPSYLKNMDVCIYVSAHQTSEGILYNDGDISGSLGCLTLFLKVFHVFCFL